MSTNIFNHKIMTLDDVEIHFIDIEELTKEMTEYIDENLVSICKGRYNQSTLDYIKKKAVKFFREKDRNTRNGATAEFFIHLYLKSLKYGQECMFFNMEENSIKKGFDGYYSKEGEEWILESKSGDITTKNISHHAKIKEAYKGLKNQLEGAGKNDPWENAYQHANSRDVLTDLSIVKKMQSFSEKYEGGIYYSTRDFNIIPAATIFLDGNWKPIMIMEVYEELKKFLPKTEYKKMIIICCTKKSLDLFMNYLNVPR